MTTMYELEALDDNKDVLGEFKQIGFLQFQHMVEISKCLIVVMDLEGFRNPEAWEEQNRLANAIGEKLGMQVLILNMPNADKVKFLKVKQVVDNVQGKDLYKRKLRVRRKREEGTAEETDAEESPEEEKVQAEEVPTGNKERTVRGIWAF